MKGNVIEERYSPWAAQVVLERKKNGMWCFCINYRKFNEVTIKDSGVDNALTALPGSAGFSTMDLQDGYWQVELEESDIVESSLYNRQVSLSLQSYVNRTHKGSSQMSTLDGNGAS